MSLLELENSLQVQVCGTRWYCYGALVASGKRCPSTPTGATDLDFTSIDNIQCVF
jgi:hypothetical protein